MVQACGLTVDVEAPSPGNLLRKDTTKDWPKSTGQTPGRTNHAEVFSAVPSTTIRFSSVHPKAVSTNLILNKSLMQMFARMIRPPPPIPCITLPPISIRMFMDRAAIKDPKKKTRLARRRIGFRPKMSLNLPHVGTLAADASRKADPIQE